MAGFEVTAGAPLGIPFYEINRIADQSDASEAGAAADPIRTAGPLTKRVWRTGL